MYKRKNSLFIKAWISFGIPLLLAWASHAAEVLFIVADTTPNAGSGEAAVLDRLSTDLGHNVSLVTGSASAATDANGKDLIIISSKFSSSNINSKFRDVTQPILTWESYAYDDMQITAASGNRVSGQTQISITQPSHPLAAGFSGNVTVSSSESMAYGLSIDSAHVIATQVGNTSRALLFVYEAGEMMGGGLIAPGLRIGFFLYDDTADALTTDGWTLFDNAVDYALPPPPPAAAAVERLRSAAEPMGPSNHRTDLVLSELMYHPADRSDGLEGEFIEIFNAGRTSIDLTGWKISGEVDFDFPNTTLAAQSYALVAKNPADVESIYGVSGVWGSYNGKLSNGGGRIAIEDARGGVMIEVNYGDAYPWPVSADGAGHSLVLRRPSYGEDHPYAWEASDVFGGSAGTLDPDGAESNEFVVINEVLAHTDLPQVDTVELFNRGVEAVDLSGYVLTDDVSTNKYIFPAASSIASGTFLVLDQNALNFSFSAAGEAVYLISPADDKVIDAWHFGAQENGVSLGRTPDGARRIAVLASNTLGSANARARTEDIVINEIMFNPISGDENDDYMELYNRGPAAVDLSHWQIRAGLRYVFPTNTVLASGAYLVLAKNSGQLISKYAALNAANCLGDFEGNLSNSGEWLQLVRPDDLGLPNQDFVTVDEVEYRSGGRWGKWSDGGGSSLELRDAGSDNHYAANWGDSDESGKAPWTTVDATGLLENAFSGTNPDEIHLYLLGAGEVLVDDVSVQEVNGGSPGGNKVGNDTFDSNLNNWIIQGNHIASFRNSAEGFSGASLQLVAESRGDNSVNKAEYNLSSGLANGDTARLSAKVRWLRGYPVFVMRLHGNSFTAAQELDLPDELGSPGLLNSIATNAPPAIHHVLHHPALPAARQDVVVQVRADDADGLVALNLVYRFDPSLVTTSLPLVDDGTGDDALAQDGLYTATIPGDPLGSRAVFFVEAVDGASQVARFPEGAENNCIVRFGSSQTLGNFSLYQFWLTDDSVDAWASAQGLGNARYDSTFIYEASRVIYNARGRFRSSPFNRPDIGHPVNSGESPKFNWKFPDDDELQGGGTLILNGQVDASGVGEKVTLEFAKKMKLPTSHSRLCYYYINGVKQGPLYLDIQHVDRNFISSNFDGNNDGEFFKLRDWHEFNDNAEVDMLGRAHADLEDWKRSNGEIDKDRYRFHMARRSPRVPGDDYSPLFDLITALNLPVGQAYQSAVEEQVDVENWMRHFAARHASGDWDALGFRRGKNCFIYQPEGGRWSLIPWDFERSFDVLSTVPTNNSLIDTISLVIPQMYAYTPFARTYYNVLYETATVAMEASYFNALVDENRQAVLDAGESSSASIATDMKTWAAGRRAFILADLSSMTSVAFEILTNGGMDFSMPTSLVTLQGNAPVGDFNLLVNGIGYPVVWMGNTSWSIDVPLAPGANLLTVQGLDSEGLAILGHSDSITITYDTTGSIPAVSLNEWLADNASVNQDPSDGDYEDWLEIYNAELGPVDLSGWRLTDDALNPTKWVFPSNSVIVAGGWLTVWADNETAQTNGLHASFSINDSGDSLYLLNKDGLLVDSVTFGFQKEDFSQGRFADGSTNILTLAPTFGAANQEVIINVNPVIIGLVDQNASEGALLTFTIQASDSNIPAQTLRYALGSNSPAGAAINSTNGVFTWLPSELQGGQIFTLQVQVIDSFIPPGMAAENFTVTVAEVNVQPGLLGVSDQTVDEETPLNLIMQATDSDLPQQNLLFSLVGDVPAGATLGATNGVFSWTPSEMQGPATFDVTVAVTDTGTPPLEDLKQFKIVVNEVNQEPVIVPFGVVRLHGPGIVNLQISASDPDFPLQSLEYALNGQPSNITIGSVSGVLRVEVGEFDAGNFWAGQITVSDTESTVNEGFVVQIIAPILQTLRHGGEELCVLEWNSYAGGVYDVEYRDNPLSPDWLPAESVLATGATSSISVSTGNSSTRIYRVVWRP